MGSKNRHAKHLLPLILEHRQIGQCYVEPFVGGANMIDKVDGWRIGADVNEHVITLFVGLQNGFLPPDHVSEEEYQTAKKSNECTPLKAFIGFGCSYSGKWFGGYARGNTSKGEPRNYCIESKRNILRQKDAISGVMFKHECYQGLEIPDNSIVYCDPPYAKTTKYRDAFNHEEFWGWCESLVKNGHRVFVSEYSAPKEWVKIWSKVVNNSLTQNTGSKKGVECLFAHQSQRAI